MEETLQLPLAPANGVPHDAMDNFVARIALLFERLFSYRSPEPQVDADIAFSDEWERRHIDRELHLN